MTDGETLDYGEKEGQNAVAGCSSEHKIATPILPGPTSTGNLNPPRLASRSAYFSLSLVKYIYDLCSSKKMPASRNPTANTPNTPEGAGPPGTPSVDLLYVHWCVNPALSVGETRYASIEISEKRRNNFFHALQETFWGLRGGWTRWFSPMACLSIKFFKVSYTNYIFNPH